VALAGIIHAFERIMSFKWKNLYATYLVGFINPAPWHE